jgi:two-component system, cell cycle sensor histidine kinase and response regulator CckA
LNSDSSAPSTPGRVDAPFKFQTAVIDLLIAGESGQQILDDVCLLVEAELSETVASIMALDTRGERLWLRAAPSLPEEARQQLDGLLPGEFAGSCGTAVFTGEPALVDDTMTDPRWRGMQEFAQRFRVRSCWSIPVAGPDGEPIGSFAISRFIPGGPSPQERELLDTVGHVVGLALIREEQERETRDRDQLIRAVVESADEGICVRDLAGRFVYVNDAGAAMVGSTTEEIVGRTPSDFFSEKAAAESRLTDDRVIESGESLSITFRNRWVGDIDRVTQVRKYPRLNSKGEVVGVISISRDVTNFDRNERAVQQAQKLDSLGMLASGIAHDFNNILVGILGNSEWAIERARHDIELQASLSEIRRASLRAKALTGQILAYAGAPSEEREFADVSELIRDVLELAAGAMSRRAKVQLHFPDHLAAVELDPTQIRQVIMNLVVNASDALGGEEGGIDITVDETRVLPQGEIQIVGGHLPPGHYVRIQVRDDGKGMDEETLERIFDPFFTTKSQGQGLGLAALLGILRAHGGGIRAVSELGAGSTFEVFLPVTAEGGGRGLRADLPSILVVDDEGLVRKTTRRLLEARDWNVATAADTVEAARLLDDGRMHFDLVILDINLPGESGVEFAERLRKSHPELPYLLTTGGVNEIDRELHGVVVLRKPFTRDELMSAVERSRRRSLTSK